MSQHGGKGTVTERTFYPPLIEAIHQRGGSGVSEVSFNSEPDIIFKLLGQDWLLSVKIGESLATLKSAFIQYQRHKEESDLTHGLLLFLPDSIRKTRPIEAATAEAIASAEATCLIDTPVLKEEYGRIPFPQVLDRLITEIGPKLERRVRQAYPLRLVISLLQQHVSDMMSTISMSDELMLHIITDRKLLAGIGRLRIYLKRSFD